tara:strand:- start:407 stop:1018 length:612 start_codon:yes stop_codon:yes gene_type:complete
MNFTRINKHTANTEFTNNNLKIRPLPVVREKKAVDFTSSYIRKPVNPVYMPNKDQMTWGRATWFLFHTLAHKVKDQYFLQVKSELCNNIFKICSSLPCLMCQEHAVDYMKKVNFNNIKTKTDLKNMLFNFHNVVNENKGYKKFTYEELDKKYEEANLHKIINNFFSVMSKSKNRDLVAHNMYADSLNYSFKMWLSENIKYFNI